MATKATPVTEAEKDEPNVKEVVAQVPGIGPVKTYFRVEKVDDLDKKTADDVQSLRFAVPVEKQDDDENTFWAVQHRAIDLGKVSRDKLLKALKPFIEASEEVSAPGGPGARTASAGGPNPALTEWNRRAKTWLEENRPHHGVKHNTKGRLKAEYEDEYATANNDPKPA
jgi:hypothetical protein